MRILHVIPTIDPVQGGPVSVIAGLAPAQVAAGMRVVVLATYRAGEDVALAGRLRESGIEVELIGPATGPLRRHAGLAAAVRSAVGKADVVHVHALWEEVQHQAARAAERAGVPYLVTPHGMLDPWSLSQSRWKKRLYLAWRLRHTLRQARALHFTTRTESELVAPLRLGPPGFVETLGVDLAEFERLPPRGEFRSRYQLGDRPLVLFLGRVHPKKGLDLLIPAFAEARIDDAVLVVAGPCDDDYFAKLKGAVAARGMGGRVVFTGMLRGRERVAALADADLFVLPSYQENFGIAVVEALASGTPVVISDQVNIWRDVAGGSVGGVVKTNVRSVTEELRRWMTQPELRRGAAERARPFVWQRYDWRQIAGRWNEHYARVARGQTAAA